MGAFFVKGETKTRAGVYRRYDNGVKNTVVGADDGTVAVCLTSDWGPIGEALVVESLQDAKAKYGNSDNVKKTLLKVMELGVKKAVVARVGTGGTKSTLTLKDTTSGTAVDVVKLDTKYPTNRTFKISIRVKAGDATTKIIDIIEGTTVVETFRFAAGSDEVQSIIATINQSSSVLDATKIADGNGTLAGITQVSMTGGTNPGQITNENYSTALNTIEPYRFNVLIVDSNTTAIHAIVDSFVTRIKDDGALNMAVIGEPTSVELETRLSAAKAYNKENIVYVGGSYYDSEGNAVEGFEAAAVVAAAIATTSSNSSIVHKTIYDAVEVKEKLTNVQHEKAIKSGCIMFSESSGGTVWIESGVNTLTNPGELDDGWKKIKRVKVRQELIDRIQRTLEPVIGKINCDSDGVANVINLGKQVIDAMVSEGKLYSGDMYEDTDNPYGGDAAWFVIESDDIDTLEKIYLSYQFRFSAN